MSPVADVDPLVHAQRRRQGEGYQPGVGPLAELPEHRGSCFREAPNLKSVRGREGETVDTSYH